MVFFIFSKIEPQFPLIYISIKNKSNMDYKRALTMKVLFEKDWKPFIKEHHDFDKHVLEEKKDMLKRLIDKSKETEIPFDRMDEVEQKRVRGYIAEHGEPVIKKIFMEQRVRQINIRIDKTNEEINKRKAGMFVWSYLYQEDADKAVSYFHKYKDLKYIEIEDPERYDGLCLYDGSSSDEPSETLTGEGAYLSLCDGAKETLDIMEHIINFLEDYKIAKEVLKAGRKMNKRKGKKNRGKK